MNILSDFRPLLEPIVAIILVILVPVIIELFKGLKNNSIIEDQLLELQFDNSEYANNKRLELFEQKSIDDMVKETNNVFETSGDVNKVLLKNNKGSRCQYCGTKHNDTEKSCSGCGAPL